MTTQVYTILDVVRRTGVSRATILRWERRGIPTPKPRRRARTRARLYSDELIAQIEAERDRIHEDD
jgi:DNA-binding transcriptional MerR regulator